MQNIFDYNARASQSLLGGEPASRALGLPVPQSMPGNFAPGASNEQADALLSQIERQTATLGVPRPRAPRAPVVGYNPQTNEVFSGGRTFQLDLDQGASNAQLLDLDNPELPQGFVPVLGDEVKARLSREYESLGMLDSTQRRAGQALANFGSTMQDAGLPGAQALQDYGGALARRNPSKIAGATDLLQRPGTAVSEAIGEVAYDIPVALAQTAAGAAAGAKLGAVAAPFTGGASIPLGAILGGAAGRFLGTLGETYGSVRAEQRASGQNNMGRAAVAASGSAALEALLGPEAVLGGVAARAIGGAAARGGLRGAAGVVEQGALRRYGTQMAAGALAEGPLTEVPQSAIERWGASKDLTGAQAMDEYAVGAFKGAVGGAAASPLSAYAEYSQAKNFVDNLQEDIRIASDIDVASPERLAAAKRAQDVLRGASDDPRFDRQLQEFRQKLQFLDAKLAEQAASQETVAAIAEGAPADLLALRPQQLERDRAQEQDARLAAKAEQEAMGLTPELSSILAADRAGAQWQELRAKREQALATAAALGPQVEQVLGNRSAQVLRAGDLIEQVGAQAQPIVQGLEAQAAPIAAQEAGQQFDQVMSGNLQTALDDPQTFGPYLDWQNAAMGAEPGVASRVDPVGGPRSPWAPSPRGPVAATLPPVAPALSSQLSDAPVVSSLMEVDDSPAESQGPAGFSSPDPELDGDIDAEVERVLKAQAASEPGQVSGRVTLPQGVLAGVARAVRGNKAPVVYAKGKGRGNIDAAATAEWADRMRAMTDAAKYVAEAFHALSIRETRAVPSDKDRVGKQQGDKSLTDKDATAAAVAAQDAFADVMRLRSQLRTAIDMLREAMGGDKNVDAVVAVLKGRVHEKKPRGLAKLKADVSLDVNLSQAWAQYKDGALDNLEQADVIRARPIRDDFESAARGVEEFPNVNAAEQGSTRRPMKQGRNESDKAFAKRVADQTEYGVLGVISRLQLHGTGFEKMLAASVGRALRRFSGADAPALQWLEDDAAAPYYDPKKNTLFIHKEASPEEILHETLHAALQWYVYQNPETAEVRLLEKALEKVLSADPATYTGKAAEVVAVLRKIDKGRSKTARLDAVLELVSYGSTLYEFRKALKGMESVKEDSSLFSGLTAIWNRLTLLVQRFLGVSNTVANDVLDGTMALLELAADPGIDTPGKRKGNVLRADVMSGMPDPATLTEPQLLQRPGASLPADVDVSRYNKKVLPEALSTKFIFDALGWDKVAAKVTKGAESLSAAIQKDFPGLARWVTYINARFAVPQDTREAFEQYKDDKQAGYKLTERLATFIQFQPPSKVLAIFDYLDGDKTALGSDTAMAELADEVKRWRDFYVEQLGNDKASRFFSSGKFSETMLFATDSSTVANQTFGMRRLNSMLGEKKQTEKNLEEGWMNATATGDPELGGAFYEVYRMQGTTRVHDGFMAREQFERNGPPAGHQVDTEYVWFHTGFANGTHTFRASMTAKQAVSAKRADDLANALRNTMAALATNYASKQFSSALAAFGHKTGHPDTAVAFDSIEDAEKALGVKIDPRNVLKAGSTDARSARTQHLYRSPHLWVQLPNNEAYGALRGKVMRSGVWSAMQDMSDRRPVVDWGAFNDTMRWFKKAKTVYNPGTHVTNVASNFTLAMLHDIPVATIKEAAKLFLQYERNPNAMPASQRQLVLAFIGSNAMVGDFSSAEVKQALYEAMKDALEDGKPTLVGRLTAMAKLEKARAAQVQKAVDSAKGAADRVDEAMTNAYAAGDNVFRLAAFLKHAADRAALRDDGKPTPEDLQAAGDFARWAFLDYDIDSKAVRAARQTVLPFISWTYAVIPVLAKIAVHQPWKLANVMLAYAVLEHVMQEVAGGDEEDERLRKVGPQYVRDRMYGFGPYVHVRVPFLGDDKTPVYYRLGDYMPWTTVARGQPNGFMGQEWFPSAITPTGPLVSALLTAMGGIDPYFGKPLNAPTDSQWEKLLTRGREMAALALPPVAVDLARWEKIEDMTKGRVDRPEGFEALQMARWAGLKAYSFGEDQARVAQNKAVQAIMSEYKQELGKLRRAEARFERPDWEGFAEKQRALLARMNEEIADAKGE